MSDWISVKDRLPEVDLHVLLFLPDGSMMCGCRRDIFGWELENEMFLDNVLEDVLAWMRLPKPYIDGLCFSNLYKTKEEKEGGNEK